MAVFLPKGYFQHQYFFYLRGLGWDEVEELSDDRLADMLDDPVAPRPVLLPDQHYSRFWERAGRSDKAPISRIPFDSVVLLTPGPYAACGIK